jgi:hypothetical protein
MEITGMRNHRTIIAVGAAVLALAACDVPTQQTPTKTTQAQRAQQAANQVRFTENAEIDNIKARLELTANPGLLGYVALINGVGQVVLYTPVKGKITSGSKRLTKTYASVTCDKGEWNGDCIVDAPSDEGTYGSSNPYVYFWTPGGQYIQTSMEYVYSDKPFRLSEEPIMVTAEVAASASK